MKEIIAHPAELIIAKDDEEITSYALGSGMGICIYDTMKHIAGFIQSLLPKARQQNDNDLKYIDTAFKQLYELMLKEGCQHEHLVVKLVGGATLFQFPDEVVADIGRANTKSAYHMLEELKLPLAGEDVGDRYGRTLHFQVEDGLVHIMTKNKYLYTI